MHVLEGRCNRRSGHVEPRFCRDGPCTIGAMSLRRNLRQLPWPHGDEASSSGVKG